MTEKMIRVQFSVPRELGTRLKRYAVTHDMTLSDCIRAAIAMELARPTKPKAAAHKPKLQRNRE